MSAAHYKLDNLTALVDRNVVQIDGTTEDVMQLEPLADKWHSFGWHVIHCDGHDIKDIIKAYQEAQNTKNKPSMIIAKTVMGKGVKSIEGDYRWHGRAPREEELSRFLSEIEKSYESGKET